MSCDVEYDPGTDSAAGGNRTRPPWFHDAVYDPQRIDNEAQSAALLRTLGTDSGLTDRSIDRAARLVRATDHKTEPVQGGEADMANAEAIIADVDMPILAAPPDQYLICTRQIRQEYSRYDDLAFSQGRALFLKSLLPKPQIYRTARFREDFEASARSNLRRELDSFLHGRPWEQMS